MKRYLTSCFLLVVGTIAMNAQVSVGIGGLLQNTSLSGDDPFGGFFRSGIGYGVNATVAYDVTKDISLFLQPTYDSRVTNFSYNVSFVSDGEIQDSVVDSSAIYMSSISFPLGLRIYNNAGNWYFSTGASVSLIMSTKAKKENGSERDITDMVEPFDVMLFAGVGYRIPIDPINLLIEARYQQGLIDVAKFDSSVSFAYAPTIRQSGLLLNLSAEIPLGAQPSVQDSQALEGTTEQSPRIEPRNTTGPRLGDHLFGMPVGLIDPLVRTVTTFSIRGGATTGIDFPIKRVNDSIVIAPRGDLVLANIFAQHEQKIKEWFSFRAYLNVTGRLGTNVTSLLAQGVNTQIGFGIGWKAKIIENYKFALTSGLDLRNSDITSVDLDRWVQGIIDSGKVTERNPLVDTKPSLRTVVFAAAAYSFNEAWGLLGSAEAGYAESSTRENSGGIAATVSAALSTNWQHILDVPIGTTLGIAHRQIPEVDDGTSDEATTILLRIGYSGTDYFALGVQFGWVFTRLQNVDPSISLITAALDMKFYY